MLQQNRTLKRNRDKVFFEKITFVVLIIVFAGSLFYTRKRFARDVSDYGDKFKDAYKVDMARIRERLFSESEREPIKFQSQYRSPLDKPLEALLVEQMDGLFLRQRQSPEKAQEEFILEGIVWGEGESIAIISGNVVMEGEAVNGAKVLSISQNEVILIRDGEEIHLMR